MKRGVIPNKKNSLIYMYPTLVPTRLNTNTSNTSLLKVNKGKLRYEGSNMIEKTNKQTENINEN